MSQWTDAVMDAVRRQAGNAEDGSFTRRALLDEELDRIVAEAGSLGLRRSRR